MVNKQEIALIGAKLAAEFEAEAEKIFYRDERHDYAQLSALDIRKKVAELTESYQADETAGRDLDYSLAYPQAASLAEREEWFFRQCEFVLQDNRPATRASLQKDDAPRSEVNRIAYQQIGTINSNAPLEAFYEAMLPLLKNYGLTAEFPADKPSLKESIYGIEFDVLLGAPPAALRYLKWQGSPYANGGLELTLESETLVHAATGEKLLLQIYLTDYLSGRQKSSGDFWLTVKFSGAEAEVKAFQAAIAPVLARCGFASHEVTTAPLQLARLLAENA